MSRIKFMNTEIDNLTMQETLQAIDQLIQENRSAYVVTPNVDHIVQLETSKELKAVYENASLILTDGKPLLWIAKWYGTPIKEKISGSDLFPRLCNMAAKKGYKLFFLGAAEGVAAKAAENLANKFKGLQVVGTYSPPFGFENNQIEMDKIKSMIKESKPDILIVGLGCPKQEKFMYIIVKNLECQFLLVWVQVLISRQETLKELLAGWRIMGWNGFLESHKIPNVWRKDI